MTLESEPSEVIRAVRVELQADGVLVMKTDHPSMGRAIHVGQPDDVLADLRKWLGISG